jgi:hypothetical protein
MEDVRAAVRAEYAKAVSAPANDGRHEAAAADDSGAVPDWVGEAAGDLPERPGGKGPTHGLLYAADGERLSAQPLTQADAMLRSGDVPRAREGLRADWYPDAQVISEHVEGHAAALLRQPDAPRDAVLVLNNQPCLTRGGYVGCDEVLPGMLPEDTRLRVYIDDGRQVRAWNAYYGTGEGIAP